MTPRNKEVAHAIHAPVLSTTLLAGVHELNRNYVDMLIARPFARSIELGALPEKILQALARLPAAARSRLAATPFALYTLRFDDQQFWRTALGDLVADRDDSLDYYCAPSVSPAITFTEMALFLAWHTAVVSRVATRVLFAMPDALAKRFAATPFWRLRRIASDYPGLLLPRWSANPCFWPDLVHFAAESNWERLETAQLLGTQLIAVELDETLELESRVMRGRSARIDVTKTRDRRKL